MSTVKSYRFDSQELYNLQQLCEELGLSEHAVIGKALEHYQLQVLNSEGFSVVCDFKDSIDGINTCAVQTFIEQVNEYTCFKTAFYLDGDKVAFELKED